MKQVVRGSRGSVTVSKSSRKCDHGSMMDYVPENQNALALVMWIVCEIGLGVSCCAFVMPDK